MIEKFRKKPVVIEAVQLIDDLDNHNAVIDWIRGHGGKAWMPALDPYIYIETLEGDMRADLGDWVIRGVKGEFYPCKDDVFALTYEPAAAPATETETPA